MTILAFNETTSRGDYSALHAAARREAAKLSIKSRADIARIYRKAADEAAEVVRDALERGLSELTVERWQAIESRLSSAADAVAAGTERVAKDVSRAGSLFTAQADADWIYSAAQAAGAWNFITRAGLGRIVAGVNSAVVESLVTRLYSDGYTFSDRVWKPGVYTRGRLKGQPISVRGDWMERIKSTVASGIAQGRDPVKIAKDIQVYTADGKVALIKRWGGLERGTAEFAKRIPGRIDWRATRLVRSELSASLQDAGVKAGEANPACTGLFDWVLSAGREHWECACESLASGGPYKAEDVPTYPHPHCFCSILPRLMDRAEFVGDLKRWAKGADVDYLDSWYGKTYKAAV